MKRKIINALLVVIAAIAIMVFTPQLGGTADAAVKASGKAGTTVNWSLSDTGVLTLTGTGEVPYVWDWTGFSSNKWDVWGAKSIIVSEGITKLGDSAFADFDNCETITLPAGLKEIGIGAFQYDSNLKTIEIPGTVTTIGDLAFMKCSSLKTITIPAGVKTIKRGAFVDCESLSSITVDSSNANYCDVDGVLFNKNKTVIVAYPSGKAGSSYAIPGTVTKVFNYAFTNSSLSNVTIPSGVTTIEEEAFADCKNITSISIPDTVTTIGEAAFAGAGLTSATVPGSVKTIYKGLFYHCSELKTVTAEQGLMSVGEWFYDCPKLESVTLPETVSWIDSDFWNGWYYDEEDGDMEAEKPVIKGYTNSFVEEFARDNDYTFISIGTHQHDYKHIKYKPSIGISGWEEDRCSICDKEINYKKLPALSPAKTAITSLSAQKKGFTVKWKKKSYTGYQIRYSTKSSMASSKTILVTKASTVSKKITKLKSKSKYYVQVRAYKTVNGTKCYSAWSTKKVVKTK